MQQAYDMPVICVQKYRYAIRCKNCQRLSGMLGQKGVCPK